MGDKRMISSRIFDAQFKNLLRDFYGYGFKKGSDFLSDREGRNQGGFSVAKNRIRDILSDVFSWNQKKGTSVFVSLDSRKMGSNPFHQLYHFCIFNDRDLVYFFNTIFLLSDGIEVRECVLEEIEKRACGEKRTTGNNYTLALRDHLKENLLLSSSEINCFCVYEKNMPTFAGENKTLNNRLLHYSELGLLKRIQLKEKGNNRWKLNGPTMENVLKAESVQQEDFEERFRYALDFFSQYFPLGEIGTFLLEKMGAKPVEFLHFKHEYFMQAVYDFNLIDLLYAMENRKWCRIKYRHGIRGGDIDILCCPLQIRISLQNGRESLMYYEPFTRNCTSLRLDFIDQICYMDEKDVYDFWREIGKSEESLQSDLNKSYRLLDELWGVSVRETPKGNTTEYSPLQTVMIQISYDPKTESYIKERLLREKRIGSVREEDHIITFKVKVSDPSELKPWLRSFYQRLRRVKGMKNGGFSAKVDIDRILEQMEGKTIRKVEPAEKVKGESWGIPVALKEALDKKTVEAKAHDQIFNEMHNVAVRLLGDLFM